MNHTEVFVSFGNSRLVKLTWSQLKTLLFRFRLDESKWENVSAAETLGGPKLPGAKFAFSILVLAY